MENTTVKAQGKYIRQSPYKMRLVLNLIRGLDVQEALNVLTFTKRRAAVEIKQVLESAISNAEANYNLNASDLYISKAIADEGPHWKDLDQEQEEEREELIRGHLIYWLS